MSPIREADDTLFRNMRICGLRSNPRCQMDLTTLREWLDLRKDRPLIHGFEAMAWNREFERDLVCISSAYAEKDTFSRFIYEKVAKSYHDLLGHRLHDRSSDPSRTESLLDNDLITYSDTRLSRAVLAAVTILASVLPPASTFALYYIHDPVQQMGAIVGLTFIFGLCVSLFTHAKTAEVFVASAGFTAVLVVFLGNNNCRQG